MKLGGRIRLSSLLLLILVLAVLLDLYLVRRRQARTLAAIALYRQPVTEGIYDILDEPLVLTYPDEASLEDLLKEMKRTSTGKPKLPFGIPIYVDPVGLQEAHRTMQSRVKRPEPTTEWTLDEHLRRVLEPLGLCYQVGDGFLTITSTESADAPVRDREDPYLKFRDVLR
jgi:hypothetical protein